VFALFCCHREMVQPISQFFGAHAGNNLHRSPELCPRAPMSVEVPSRAVRQVDDEGNGSTVAILNVPAVIAVRPLMQRDSGSNTEVTHTEWAVRPKLRTGITLVPFCSSCRNSLMSQLSRPAPRWSESGASLLRGRTIPVASAIGRNLQPLVCLKRSLPSV
jgi:hypothetical protein